MEIIRSSSETFWETWTMSPLLLVSPAASSIGSNNGWLKKWMGSRAILEISFEGAFRIVSMCNLRNGTIVNKIVVWTAHSKFFNVWMFLNPMAVIERECLNYALILFGTFHELGHRQVPVCILKYIHHINMHQLRNSYYIYPYCIPKILIYILCISYEL